MPLKDEQRAWLERLLGVKKGLKAKGTKFKRTKEYTAFIDKKNGLDGLADQLKEYDFAQNRAEVLKKKLQGAEDNLNRQAEGDLKNALKQGNDRLDELKSDTDKDLKFAKKIKKSVDVLHGNEELIGESPAGYEDQILEIKLALRAARKSTDNGDFEQAYDDLASVEKSSTILAKTATKEAAPRKEWEARKEEFDKLLRRLEGFDFAERRASRLRNNLQNIETQLAKQAKGNFKQAHEDSVKELASLKSDTDADLKSAELLHKRIEIVRSNGRLIKSSPHPQPELMGIALTLRAAEKRAQNGDFAEAYKDLADAEKLSSSVAKSAEAGIAEKKKWDLCEADVKTCIEILEMMKLPGDTTTTALKKSLEDAQKDAKDKKFKAAYDGLKNYKKTYDKEYKVAEAKQQAVVANLAKADLVDGRLEEIDLLLDQVSVLPGLTAWIAAKKTERDAIEVNKDTYVDAWTVLEKSWKVEKLRSAAEAESAKQSKKALKNEALKKLNSNVQNDLNALQDLATDDMLKTYRDSLAKGMDIYISAINGKSTSFQIRDAETAAKKAITELDVKLNNDLKNLGPIKKACEDERVAIERGLEMLDAAVSIEARSRFGLEWERLSAALAIKEFEKSLPKLKTLHKEIRDLVKESARETKEWEKQRGDLEKNITAGLKKVGECPVTSHRAAELRSEWQQLLNLGRQREPGQAIDGLEGLTLNLENQLELVEQYDALADARKAANLKVKSELELAAGEIEKLKVAVANTRASDSPAKPAEIVYEADLKLLTTEWEGDMKGAYTVATELEKKTADMVSKIAEMLKGVAADASDPKAIGAIASAQESDEKELAYLKQVEEVRAKIEELGEVDSRASIKFEKLLMETEKDSSKDYDKAIKAATKTLKDVSDAITEAEIHHKNTLASVKLTAEATRKKVAETEKSLGSGKTGFKEFFANLRSLIDDMEKSMMASSSVTVLMSANHEFNEILRPMYEIVADAEKPGKDKLDYSSVFKTVVAQDKYLNSDTNLEECQPTMKSLLLEKFQGIQTSIKAQSPREATATLEAFQKELDDIKVKADSSQAKRNSFKLNAKTVKAKLKKLNKTLDYTRSLEAKFKGIEGTAMAENKEEKASNNLVLLIIEIDRALNDPEFVLDKEKEVRAAERLTEKNRKTWEANIEAFGTVMSEVNKAMKKAGDDADLTQLHELEGMKKESKSIAKGGDYVMALKKLEMASEHAKNVIANPVGDKVTSRNSLSKDLARYQGAVTGFNTHMKKLVDYLKKEGTDIEKKALTAATQMLNSMQFEFDTKVFDKAVGLLSNKKADTGAKRAAREGVLSTVRSYQTRLDKGPLMLKVLLAPFDLDARPAFNELRSALNSLDVNVRRCV